MTLLVGGERGQMLFAHDTEVSLNATAALVNTARGGSEELPDVAALDAFAVDWRWTGSRTHDQEELDQVRRCGRVSRGCGR